VLYSQVALIKIIIAGAVLLKTKGLSTCCTIFVLEILSTIETLQEFHSIFLVHHINNCTNHKNFRGCVSKNMLDLAHMIKAFITLLPTCYEFLCLEAPLTSIIETLEALTLSTNLCPHRSLRQPTRDAPATHLEINSVLIMSN